MPLDDTRPPPRIQLPRANRQRNQTAAKMPNDGEWHLTEALTDEGGPKPGSRSTDPEQAATSVASSVITTHVARFMLTVDE